MASLKKEVAALLSRFDAAQEAFTANTTDVKKLSKKHKKELKSAKKQIKSLEEEVADLKKELSEKNDELTLTQAKVMEQGKKAAPASASKNKQRAGRPKKTKAATKVASTDAVSSDDSAPMDSADDHQADDHQANTDAPATPAKPKRRGRPAGTKSKTAAGRKPAAGGKKRGPGRPRTKPAVPASPLTAITGVGPALAKALEAGGINTVAQAAKASNAKITEIFNGIGRRYNNPTQEKIQAFRDSANAAK